MHREIAEEIRMPPEQPEEMRAREPEHLQAATLMPGTRQEMIQAREPAPPQVATPMPVTQRAEIRM